MNLNDSKSHFRPRFSVRTLLLVITLVCAWLGWDLYTRRARNEQVCDQEVDRVMLATHWKAEQSGVGAELVQWCANDFRSQTSCATSLLQVDGAFADGTAPDPYEQQLLSEWLKNAIPAPGSPSEHADRDSWFSSTFVYYKAIRAKASCVACHSTLIASKAAANGKPAPPLLKVGDLMAIGRVQLAK